MKTIQLTSHVGNEGILSLRLPEEMKGQNLEIWLVLQPIKNTSTHRNA